MAESMLIIYNFFLRITLNRQKNVKRDCGRIENTLYFPAFIFPWLFEQEVPHFHFSEPENEVSMKIVTSGPITSWEIDGETVETVSDCISLGSKITADGECSREIKRHLLLGRKTMTNIDSTLKSRNITLPTKVWLVKAMVSSSSHVWM